METDSNMTGIDGAATLVVLIHGFCRGAKHMRFWRERLGDDFPHIITPDLPTTFSSFERCLEVLTREIDAAAPEKYASLCVAGHSMGGLLAREYLQNRRPLNARRLVCVGTPHLGSRLADIALYIPGAGHVWRPLHALKPSARRQITIPDIPGLSVGVITSCNNGHWPGKLFFRGPADGMVERFSALAPDAADAAGANAPHAGMMYDARTVDLIRKFFLDGRFQ